MNLKQLINESYQIAKNHGWHDPEPPFENHIVNIHCELSEAWEEWRNNRGLDEIYWVCKRKSPFDCVHSNYGICECNTDCNDKKPCGIPIELADTIIRICDTLGSILPENHEFEIRQIRPLPLWDFAKFYNYATKMLVKVNDSKSLKYRFGYFVGLICGIQEFCEPNKIDLDFAIELKMNYNKGREHRHGGKRA